MSSINFRAHGATARVSGAERAQAGVLTQNLMMSVLDMVLEYDSVLSGAHLVPDWAQKDAATFRFWWMCSPLRNAEVSANGKHFHMLDVSLNTSLMLGSDPVRLLARIHGQCELHCWVDGEHAVWLATIIRSGLKHRIMRSEMGWDDVIELLESKPDIVVLDYSVCDRFPNPIVAQWESPQGNDWDAWYSLSEDEQWRLSIQEIRKRKDLQLSPDTWSDFCFADGYTAMDLIDACVAEKSRKE